MGTATSLDARLGSFRHRCWQGLLRNSAQFPMANLLLEVLLEGWRILLAPDVYMLQAPPATGPRRELMVKGKQAPIEVSRSSAPEAGRRGILELFGIHK